VTPVSGVAPDVSVAADQALDVAKKLAGVAIHKGASRRQQGNDPAIPRSGSSAERRDLRGAFAKSLAGSGRFVRSTTSVPTSWSPVAQPGLIVANHTDVGGALMQYVGRASCAKEEPPSCTGYVDDGSDDAAGGPLAADTRSALRLLRRAPNARRTRRRDFRPRQHPPLSLRNEIQLAVYEAQRCGMCIRSTNSVVTSQLSKTNPKRWTDRCPQSSRVSSPHFAPRARDRARRLSLLPW